MLRLCWYAIAIGAPIRYGIEGNPTHLEGALTGAVFGALMIGAWEGVAWLVRRTRKKENGE